MNVDWVILELTPKADGEDPEIIASSIRRHIKNAEVFVPASVVQREQVREYHWLMEGYAFIKNVFPLTTYKKLEETRFVQTPLYQYGKTQKLVSTITQQEIDDLKAKIKIEVDQGIDVGDEVMVISGPYKNISAHVTDVVPEIDSVMLRITLRSTDRLVTLPRAFLSLTTKSPISAFVSGLEKIRGWSNSFSLFLNGDYLQALKNSNRDLSLLDRVVEIENQIERLSGVPTLEPLPSFQNLGTKLTEVKMFEDSYEGLLVDIAESDKNLAHIIVDGTQLYIRCLSVPGLDQLTDAEGRRTGGIVGFLRALASYKKRFPQSKVTVCWDGSSQRRKSMFSDYKANRPARSGNVDFGWEWLRNYLPSIGVIQAYNAVEEADDVMASLTWEDPNSINLLITTDRDLLQTVTDNTHVLCPAMGAGKEKIYTPQLVEEEYGVTPAKMVQLRALSGDTSDNIPGASGFGPKTASKAISHYGSIDSLLKSNLAGMTKLQATNIKNATKQLKLNVELMALRKVDITRIPADSNKDLSDQKLRTLGIRVDSVGAFFK